MTKDKSTNSNRGWVVYACCIIVTLFFQGLVSNQQGLMLEPVSAGLGMSRTTYSLLDSFTQTFNAVANVLFAIAVSKLTLKRMFKISSFGPAIYCFAIVLASFLPGIWPAAFLGFGQASLGIFIAWAGCVPVSVLVNNWFAKRRGLMISIAQSSCSLGGVLFAPIISAVIRNQGWEMSLIYRGIVCLVGAIFICIVLKVKPDPSESRIWETQADDSELETRVDPDDRGLTRKQAMRTPQFWFAFLMFFLGTIPTYVACAVSSAYASDLGFVKHSGTVMSVYFGACLAASLPMGSLFERFGSRKVLLTLLPIMILGCIFASVKNMSVVILYAAVACLGFTNSFCTVPLAMYAKEFFGDKYLGEIQSMFFFAALMGCIVGYPVFNIGYQFFGSYRECFMLSIPLLAVVVILAVFATKKIDYDKFYSA